MVRDRLAAVSAGGMDPASLMVCALIPVEQADLPGGETVAAARLAGEAAAPGAACIRWYAIARTGQPR